MLGRLPGMVLAAVIHSVLIYYIAYAQMFWTCCRTLYTLVVLTHSLDLTYSELSGLCLQFSAHHAKELRPAPP